MNVASPTSERRGSMFWRLASVIPNVLSFTRLALGIWFPWVPENWRTAVVVVGAATDFLDGALSRALRATSTTGRIVDPIADKLFVLSVLGTLMFEGAMPLWHAALVAFRDIAVLAGVIGVILRDGLKAIREMPPSVLGKCATVAQIAYFLSLLGLARDYLLVFFWVAALLSVLAGVDYLRRYQRMGKPVTAILMAGLGISGTVSGMGRSDSIETIRADAVKGEPEERAIEFLSREVPAWPAENRCYSCHNNGDGARVLYRATRLNFRVPREAVSVTTRWLAEPDQWDRAEGDAPYKDKRLARIQFAAALGAAVRSGHVTDRAALERAAALVAAEQDSDGAWHVEPPGNIGSPATYGRPLGTAIAVRTLREADPEMYADQIARATRWLHALRRNSVLEAAAMMFVDAASEGDIDALQQRSLEFLLRGQNDDGGWGPFARSVPENFDTAVAILALAPHRVRPEVRTAIESGRHYLIKQQQPDGSWPATTRPAGAISYAQRISTTAWATLALIETHGLDARAE